jgi:hypothetical protein
MSCICAATLAGRTGRLGVLTAIGADSAPGVHRGAGRLTAARSATAAIAANRTMASVTFGVTKFFITYFLRYGLRSPQSCLVVWTGLPGVYHAMDSGGGRRAASAQQMNLHRPRLFAPEPEVFAY